MDEPSAPANELTTLARIGAVHGIKGWVRLISFTDPADNILDFRHFYLSQKSIPGGNAPAGKLEKIEIDESRAQGKQFIGHIKGCDDREQRHPGNRLTGDRVHVTGKAPHFSRRPVPC